VGVVEMPFGRIFTNSIYLLNFMVPILVGLWLIAIEIDLLIPLKNRVQTPKAVSFVRDFLPFMVVIVLYDSLSLHDGRDLIHIVNPTDLDTYLIGMDQLLFGTQPSVWIQKFITPQLTDIMWFAYSLHFVLPLFVGSVVYWFKRRSNFRDFILGIVLVNCIGFTCYFIFPGVGPEFNLKYEIGLNGGVITNFASNTEEMLKSTHRNAFPSLHVALSAVVLLFAYKHSKKTFWVILPLVLLLWISCIYLRQHYLIDIPAGWFLALACFYAVPRISKWWNEHWVKNERQNMG